MTEEPWPTKIGKNWPKSLRVVLNQMHQVVMWWPSINSISFETHKSESKMLEGVWHSKRALEHKKLEFSRGNVLTI